jgi:hypothetical protein
MNTDYELVERLKMVQEMIAGVSLPHEYNQLAVSKLGEMGRSELIRALDDVEEEDGNPLKKMTALSALAKFCRTIEDIQTFSEVCNKWVNDEEFDAGVGPDGSIVLWKRENPKEKISMAPPAEVKGN